MATKGKSGKAKSIPIEDGAADAKTAGERIADMGEAAQKIHEQGKSDRAAMRDAARDLGAEVMEGAKDFTGRAVDAATKATAAAAGFGQAAAEAVSPATGKAAQAAGKAATQASETAGKVAQSAAEAAVDMAGKVADVAQDVADKAEGVAEGGADALLKQAQASADEWQDKYLRLHAEWDTYRRRTVEQREEERARATESLVGDLIPVLDDFERSIEYAVKNSSEGLLDGVQQVHTKMVDTLTKSGVTVIDPAGEEFDSLEAQAVGTVDDADVPDETVKEVYSKGYKMGKKVIRPATVTVSSGGPKREKKKTEKDAKGDE